jgi:uncharacterized lipoprotein YmbA
MRSRSVFALGIAGASLALHACVPLKRSPNANFFVLHAVAEPASPAPGVGGSLVGVMPVVMPGYLDRPQIITEMDAEQVRVNEYARWAEPLPLAVTRTIAENLALRLPEDRVVLHPWPGSSAVFCRVSVQLLEFGVHKDGSVRLEGEFSLLPEASESPLARQFVHLRQGPLTKGPEGVAPSTAVGAMNELLANLSREVAKAVRALPPPPPAKTAD